MLPQLKSPQKTEVPVCYVPLPPSFRTHEKRLAQFRALNDTYGNPNANETCEPTPPNVSDISPTKPSIRKTRPSGPTTEMDGGGDGGRISGHHLRKQLEEASKEELSTMYFWSHRAFKKLADAHKREIDTLKKRNAKLEALVASHITENAIFRHLKLEITDLQFEINGLKEEIEQKNRMIQLYQEEMMKVEEEMKELVAFKERHVNAFQKVDWSEATQHVDWLVIGDRPDKFILHDICEFIQKLKDDYIDVVKVNEQLISQIPEDFAGGELPSATTTSNSPGRLNVQQMRSELVATRKLAVMQLEGRVAAERRTRIHAAEVNQLLANALRVGWALSDALDLKPTPHAFTGFGMGRNIPVYLRWTGELLNVVITKDELTEFLHRLWIDRLKSRAKPPKLPNGMKIFDLIFLEKSENQLLEDSSSVDDPYAHIDYGNVLPTPFHKDDQPIDVFFQRHVRQQQTTPEACFQHTYSLLSACKRFRGGDPNIDRFYHILRGELPEDAQYDFVAMRRKLLVAWKKEESILKHNASCEDLIKKTGSGRMNTNHSFRYGTSGGGGDGTEEGVEEVAPKPDPVLRLSDAMRVIQTMFPQKSKYATDLLRMALGHDIGIPIVVQATDSSAPDAAKRIEADPYFPYVTLLHNPQSRFAQLLASQHLEEILNNTRDVKLALEALIPPATTDRESFALSMNRIVDGLQKLDVQRPRKEMIQLVLAMRNFGSAEPISNPKANESALAKTKIVVVDLIRECNNVLHKRLTARAQMAAAATAAVGARTGNATTTTTTTTTDEMAGSAKDVLRDCGIERIVTCAVQPASLLT